MYAVVRDYSGSGAKELFDLLEERKEEVETLMRSVTGLVTYSAIRTDDGGVTVTVCQDKSGTDESIRIAREWIQENASDIGSSPPVISEGSILVNVS